MVYVNSSGTKEIFAGAYHERIAKKNRDEMKKSQNTSRENPVTFQEKEGASVTISQESQEFLAGVEERKAAQRAAKAAVDTQNSGNAFAGTGDFKQQYLVFSEDLYRNGFYDNMSDDEVKESEELLKRITAGMDSINGSGINRDFETELSHEAARLEFVSSVSALNYFAESYVPEEMRESFQDLINQYEDYNGAKVAAHKNIYDMRDESMKDIAPPNAQNVGKAVKKTQEEAKASAVIGKVTHSQEEKEQNIQDYKALFAGLMEGKGNAGDIFKSLQDTLTNYASGKSSINNVLALLNARNAECISNMKSYWADLL